MNKLRADRAKQFIPFDALKGLKEALREKEKIICKKKILSEDQIEYISTILSQVKIGDIIEVIYFDNGQYLKLEGCVTKFERINQKITIVKTKISFDNIYEIILK